MRTLRFVLIIAGTLAALGTLAVVLVLRNPERRIARLLDEAQIHKRTGRLELATKCLEEAAGLKPQDGGLKAKLARNWEARGDLAKAKELFLAALLLNPDDVPARFDLFDVELEKGELDLAQEQLGILDEKCKVLADESARDRCHAARASLLLRRGDRTGAARELGEAIGVNAARDAALRIALAKLSFEIGDNERAEKLARDVWAVRRPKDLPPAKTDDEKVAEEARFAPEPAIQDAARFLAQVLIARSAPDEAAAVAEEAWTREPEDADVALTAAQAEVARRGFDAALEIAKKLDAAKMPAAGALVRGRVAAAKGDQQGALDAFKDAARWAPGVPTPALSAAQAALALGQKDEAARLAMGMDATKANLDDRVQRAALLRDCGKLDDARKDVDAVLASAPGHAGAIDLLVRLELAAGRTRELTGELESLAKRSPGNGFLDKAKSLVALWQQDPSQAVKIERDALTSSKGADPGAAQLLTAALVLDGGVGAAVRELEQVANGAKEDAVRAQARLQAAELYLTLGRGDLALPVLQRGLSEQPRSRDLRLAVARALIGLGKDQDAVAVLAPLTDGKGEPTALVLAASASLRAKKPADALAFAKRAVDDPTVGIEALSVVALASRETGDVGAARDAFARIRTQRPSAPLGYVGAMGDLASSPASVVAVLEAAVARASAEGFGGDLAIALDLAGKSPEALQAAQSAVARSPKDPSAAWILASVLARRGQAEQAADALSRAEIPSEMRVAFHELSGEDVATFEALLAFRRHGLEREAADEAAKLAAKHPANVVVALHAARAIAATGKTDDAEKLVASAVRALPDFVPARLELGAIRRATRGPEGALETYQEGLARSPADPTLQLAVAVTLSELGRSSDAEAAYRATIKADPKSAVARNNLAWLLLEKGTKTALEEGLALARSTVADHPNGALALDTLARIELAKGDAKAALEHEKQAMQGAPGNATIRLGLAKALDAAGDLKQAANEYEIALLLAAKFDGRGEAEARLAELRSELGSKKSGS